MYKYYHEYAKLRELVMFVSGSFILLLSAVFNIAECQDDKSVEYYLNLMSSFLDNASKWEHPVDSKQFFQASNDEPVDFGSFDFIIVGAGAGGSVVTNRLTESGKFKVLLLEAGGQENELTEIPGLAPLLVRSDFNWGYKTVPQTNTCLGFENKQCNYPRGKVLGGSTGINFMVYVRGSKEDFNRWGADNPGWDYEGVLPYFKKSERSTIENEEYEYHGHEGLLSVENVKYYPNITNLFFEAAEQMDRKILDYNGKEQLGYSRIQCMTVNGRRCSGNKAFIKPAMSRESLQVLDHSLVLKVLIKDKKAYGVEFIRKGKKYYATAAKEVILSAGTINSAQLLMLSGIGPKEHLQELDIPVVEDLPVGQHVNDHQIFAALLFATNITAEETPMPEMIQNYLNGHGPLTAASGLSGIGFGAPRIMSSNPSVEYVFFSALPEQTAPLFFYFIEITQENWLAMTKPIMGKVCWGIIPILLHPKSKGSVKLKSKDPLDFPLIDPNLYSDPEGDDLEEMLSIVRDIFEMSKTPAFQSVDSQYLSDPFPACTDFEFQSDDYWKCALKQITYPILHAVASCKMGPKTDKTAVVDSRLKVHGIDSLRIVDASVMPFSISSHPTPSTFMIGEKGADLIREDHGDL